MVTDSPGGLWQAVRNGFPGGLERDVLRAPQGRMYRIEAGQRRVLACKPRPASRTTVHGGLIGRHALEPDQNRITGHQGDRIAAGAVSGRALPSDSVLARRRPDGHPPSA